MNILLHTEISLLLRGFTACAEHMKTVVRCQYRGNGSVEVISQFRFEWWHKDVSETKMMSWKNPTVEHLLAFFEFDSCLASASFLRHSSVTSLQVIGSSRGFLIYSIFVSPYSKSNPWQLSGWLTYQLEVVTHTPNRNSDWWLSHENHLLAFPSIAAEVSLYAEVRWASCAADANETHQPSVAWL